MGIGLLLGLNVKELDAKNLVIFRKTHNRRRYRMPSSEDKKASAPGVLKLG